MADHFTVAAVTPAVDIEDGDRLQSSAPVSGPVAMTPEPASLALPGLGLTDLDLARRSGRQLR
jgi:hypothetical protein